jgi:hypothetical protein
MLIIYFLLINLNLKTDTILTGIVHILTLNFNFVKSTLAKNFYFNSNKIDSEYELRFLLREINYSYKVIILITKYMTIKRDKINPTSTITQKFSISKRIEISIFIL